VYNDFYISTVASENLLDGSLVTDVGIDVRVVSNGLLQPIDLPPRTCLRAKKIAAHIIVYPNDLKATFGEQFHSLGPDQAQTLSRSQRSCDILMKGIWLLVHQDRSSGISDLHQAWVPFLF
jgi:hypothetical protein